MSISNSIINLFKSNKVTYNEGILKSKRKVAKILEQSFNYFSRLNQEYYDCENLCFHVKNKMFTETEKYFKDDPVILKNSGYQNLNEDLEAMVKLIRFKIEIANEIINGGYLSFIDKKEIEEMSDRHMDIARYGKDIARELSVSPELKYVKKKHLVEELGVLSQEYGYLLHHLMTGHRPKVLKVSWTVRFVEDTSRVNSGYCFKSCSVHQN